MESEFVKFLLAELDRRGWRKAEFARRAGLSPATVTRVVSGENSPGDDFVLGTAQAFDMPPERVMRLVGKLPELADMMPEVRDWSSRLMAVSPDRRLAAIQAVEYVIQLAENQSIGHPRPPSRRRRKKAEAEGQLASATQAGPETPAAPEHQA